MNSISNDDFFLFCVQTSFLSQWHMKQWPISRKMYRKKLPEKINGFAVKKGVKMKALLLMIECVFYIEKKATRPIIFFPIKRKKNLCLTVHRGRSHGCRHHITWCSDGVKFGHQNGQSIINEMDGIIKSNVHNKGSLGSNETSHEKKSDDVAARVNLN